MQIIGLLSVSVFSCWSWHHVNSLMDNWLIICAVCTVWTTFLISGCIDTIMLVWIPFLTAVGIIAYCTRYSWLSSSILYVPSLDTPYGSVIEIFQATSDTMLHVSTLFSSVCVPIWDDFKMYEFQVIRSDLCVTMYSSISKTYSNDRCARNHSVVCNFHL